jgi:hypothetical protein
MNKTYHDFIEAAYRGHIRILSHQKDVEHTAIPLREDRAMLNELVTMPSYHFGKLLAHYADGVSKEWGEPPVELIVKYLNQLNLSRAAIVFESDVHPDDTYIVMVGLTDEGMAAGINLYSGDGTFTGGRPGWAQFDKDSADSPAASPFVWIAAVGLELLANPTIQHVMTEPGAGLAKLSDAREKRGERAVEPMKVIRLTKRVYINGRAVDPVRTGTSGHEQSPHDRRGHYRHSKRAIPGWDGPIVETTGEWTGVSCYRRWIDDVQIKGGLPKEGPGRGHPKAAQPKAPQFRVVK